MTLPIEWIGFLNETGYGQAAFDTISALEESKKYDIRINCLNGTLSRSFLSKDSYDKMRALVTKPKSRDCIQVYHCIPPMQSRNPRGDRAIGFATFETYEPPSSWIEMLNKLDAVICPSYFNYKIFAHAGVKRPLFYIPHCIDKRIWNESVTAQEKSSKYTFLFIGTWRKRKGWPQLVEAYLREFDSKDNVQLVIKTDKIQLATQDVEKIRRNMSLKKDYPSVVFERRVFDDVSLPLFYKSVDCLVMPTLGEGFGLPAMQCMAIKVPVIVTNYSGCQEYASSDNCLLIEPSGFMIHENMDQIAQFANKKWPRIEIDAVQKSMRNVFMNPQEARMRADKAYDYVHAKFSFKAISDQFWKMMESVYRVG